MPKASALDRGRQAFERHAWTEAFRHLSDADRRSALDPEDLERLATAAELIGHDAEGAEIRTRAHQAFKERGDRERAALCAFWLGMTLMNKGDSAQAGAWFGRSRGLIDDTMDCVEQGYLLVPSALQSLFSGDPASAYETLVRAAKIAERFADPDLMALCALGRAQALIALGEPTQGLPLLDEGMVAVTAGEVSPFVAGIVYCATIEACHQIFDMRRAQEWTAALTRWVESQPDLVPFRGLCLVHRAELMQIHGAWTDALTEAQRARDRLSQPADPAVGAAWFRLAELHRVRGEFDKAEECYRQANTFGHSPQPGLALLRLAQGHIEVAEPAIRVAFDESHDVVTRTRVLPAYVEIMLETGDLEAARAASNELSALAERLGASMVHAIAAHWDGAVLLVDGDARRAIPSLRRALNAWLEVEAPYEAARARVLVGLAHRELGDEDTARFELNAARLTFAELGAAPIVARVDELLGAPKKQAGGLARASWRCWGYWRPGERTERSPTSSSSARRRWPAM